MVAYGSEMAADFKGAHRHPRGAPHQLQAFGGFGAAAGARYRYSLPSSPAVVSSRCVLSRSLVLLPRRQPEASQRVVAAAFSPKPVLFVPRRQRSALHNVVAAKLAKDKTSPELVIRCRLATQFRTT